MAISPQLTERAIESFKDFKGLVQFLKELGRIFRPLAKEKGEVFIPEFGRFVERITPAHPDKKVADIARAYEEMLEHPLAKKYLRKKPKLYLVKNNSFGAINLPEASMLGDEHMLIPEAALHALSHQGIKDMVGHEIAHNMALHTHFKRQLAGYEFDTMEAEHFVDRLGMVLAGELKTGETFLKDITDFSRNAYLEAGEKKAAEAVESAWTNRLGGYPSVNERIAVTKATMERMATAEGRSHLEAELARRLETEHQKLFPNHKRTLEL